MAKNMTNGSGYDLLWCANWNGSLTVVVEALFILTSINNMRKCINVRKFSTKNFNGHQARGK